MKYPVRHVFEVIRNYNEEKTPQAARSEAGWLEDEAGEFLYGGSCSDEQLHARVEIFKKGKWEKVE